MANIVVVKRAIFFVFLAIAFLLLFGCLDFFKPPSCISECSTDGQIVCDGTAFKECGNFDSDSCLEWSGVKNCPSGQFCESNQCKQIVQCKNECDSTSLKECTGNSFRSCENFDSDNCLEWGLPVACEPNTMCQDGQCVPVTPVCHNECDSAGFSSCDGNSVVTCGNFDSDSCLEFGNASACPSGKQCQNGQCVQINRNCEDECGSISARACSDSGYKVCGNFDSDSCFEWSRVFSCQQGNTCVDGNCVVVSVQEQGTVFVAVDSQSFGALNSEINRFIADIENDTSFDVKLKQYSFATPEQIRTDVKQVFDESDLQGVILVGEIPFRSNMVSAYNDFPTDTFFEDLDRKCGYNSLGDIVYLWGPCNYAKPYNNFKFWIGRIKPPVTGPESIELLREYFNRNHSYRTNHAGYDDKMLAYLEIFEDPQFNRAGQLENFKQSITDSEIFDLSQVDFVVPQNVGYNGCVNDPIYLNKLSSIPYKYVFVNAHGTPTQHQCSIDLQKVKDTNPRALFYDFRSCSVGRFSDENYLAGAYLFYGDGLVVVGPPVVIIGGTVLDTGFAYLLSKGASFGDAYKGSASVSWILGDPTLKMFYYPRPVQKISVDKNFVDFGTISLCPQYNCTDFEKREVVVKNIGLTNLKIRNVRFLFDDPYTVFGTFVNSFGPDKYRGVLTPGAQTILKLSVYFPQRGDYSGAIEILSDDLAQPLTVIPFSAKVLDSNPSFSVCGNGVVEVGENSQTCCDDAGCGTNQLCMFSGTDRTCVNCDPQKDGCNYEVTCRAYSDCDDGVASTFDVCQNSTSILSFCQHY